ncbi:flagellar protein FlgN [Evansella sp. AB-rgal1]|uniref:flagellar protein FlgN n=1 Tax=Evansella sp. AB-rgal1 TaxID=3242696 RepID=UPI00359E5387
MKHEIITIFQALTGVHEKFNENALEKQDAVKKGDMPALENVMKEETVLIQQLRKLENTREHVVNAWMIDKGFVKEDVTMDKLLQFFPEEERQELLLWQQRLVSEIEKLKHQNELNRKLLEESLRFVNISLDAMYPRGEYENYQRPTSHKVQDVGMEGKSLFDSKA